MGFEELEEEREPVAFEPPAGRASLVGVLYYPDILDLRLAGYELDRFEDLFVGIDGATFRQAIRVTRLLNTNSLAPYWTAHRAHQVELLVLDSIHEYGLAQVPQLLRSILGRVFEDETKNYLTINLVTVFYWACLAVVARDYAWREPRLEEWADYLAFPVESIFKF